MLCQANKFFATKILLLNQKPRAQFKPDFSNFVSILSYSPAQSLIKLGQDFLIPWIDPEYCKIRAQFFGLILVRVRVYP